MLNRYILYCFVIGIVAGAVLFVATPEASVAAEHTKDSLKTVKKNIDDKKAVLVDVREKSEWDEGHVEGAVFLPLSKIRKGIDKKSLQKLLPKDAILYAHCRSGRRCLTAADALNDLGFETRALKQGYSELIKSGFKKAK